MATTDWVDYSGAAPAVLIGAILHAVSRDPGGRAKTRVLVIPQPAKHGK